MNKIYICRRCGREFKTEVTRIIPSFSGMETGVLPREIEVPDNDSCLCLGCTTETIKGILEASEVGDGKQERGVGHGSEKKADAEGKEAECTN